LKTARDSTYLKETCIQDLPTGGDRYRQVEDLTKKEIVKDIQNKEHKREPKEEVVQTQSQQPQQTTKTESSLSSWLEDSDDDEIVNL